MSTPTRYHINCSVTINNEGDYILWSEYEAMRKRAENSYDVGMKHIGELAVERERVKALMLRVEELKKAAEAAAQVTMDYLADKETSAMVVGSLDRMYHTFDDENSIEKYIRDSRVS